MTVSTQLRRKTLPWTGVETSFAAGFPADKVADVKVLFRTEAGVESTLTAGVHYSVSLASGTKLVTVTPIALPAAAGSVTILRDTPAIVNEVLLDGEEFPAAVHQALHDRAAMRDAEIKDDTARSMKLTPTSSPGTGEFDALGYRLTNLADSGDPSSAVTRQGMIDYTGTVPSLPEVQAAAEVATAAATAAAASALAIGSLEVPDRSHTTPVQGSVAKVGYLFGAAPTFPLPQPGGYWPGGKVHFQYAWQHEFGPSLSGEGEAPMGTGLFYCVNSGASGDTQALMCLGVTKASDATMFGVNILTVSGAEPGLPLSNEKFVPLELDQQWALNSSAGSSNSIGLAINRFNMNGAGPAIQTGGINGRFEAGIILYGIQSTGLAMGAGETIGSLWNTTSGTAFVDDAWIMANTHFGRLYGADGSYGLIGAASDNYLLLRGPSAGVIVKNNAGDASRVVIRDTGEFACGASPNPFAGFWFDAGSATTVDGAGLARFHDADGLAAIEIFSGRSGTPNGAATVVSMRHNTATGRSVNTTGTVNTGGSDYAEYERKRPDCGEIAKGDLVGFDENGLVTDRFDLAISFGVKTTNPSFVGGDTWSVDAGEAPAMPAIEPRPYTGAQRPSDMVPPDPGPEPQEPDYDTLSIKIGRRKPRRLNRREKELARANFARQHAKWRMAADRVRIHAEMIAAHDRDYSAHLAAEEERQAAFEAGPVAAWAEAYTAWEARVEALRAAVDRVAYCGKAPVNVAADLPIGTVLNLTDKEGRPYAVTILATGASPGDWIVPARAPGGEISADIVADADLTWTMSKIAVGRVRRILEDGRAEIAVKPI